nr:scarecrow-like protein 8 [Tanacetum cinerariifolium]
LMVGNDDFLAVNFAFKLSKLPDESVTTENLRDEVLRRVKSLAPSVVTVAEQELNANTASFTSRVNDAFGYYKTFLDSFDATIPRENADRVKIEEGLSRRIANSVACEGRDRVERCEVFGKWRARMKMAGFDSKQVSQLSVESLLGKLNSGTRGNPGFTVKEDTGGKAFDAFCEKFHIPEEVHPVLPNRGDTIDERLVGKIGLYTIFFDFANFRLSLSTFLVDILRYFRINISQLFVIGTAKNDHFFWVDNLACPALFSWHTAKDMTRDPALVAADFNARDYATLVAHPSPFWKFPEEFLCLVGLSRHYTLDKETYPRFLHKNIEEMDLFAFINTLDPTKLKIVERERVEDEPLLLLTTVGLTVPLLSVAPDRADSQLETSIDRLFDEGGSGSQAGRGGSAGVGEGTNIQPLTEATSIVIEDVDPLQPRRQRKMKTVVADAGGSSHPPKKEDHGTLSGPSVAGKSRYAIQRLLARAMMNAEVRGEPIPTLPFVTSSVSVTPEHEGGDHTDSVIGLNLRTISALRRFDISSDFSHHYGANVAEAEVDCLFRSSVPVMTPVTITTSTADLAVVVEEKTIKPSLFAADSSFADEVDPKASVFSDLTRSDFLISGVRTVIDPDTDLQKMSLSTEVRMRTEYNIKENRRLKSATEKKNELLKARDKEIENLKAHMVLKEVGAAEAIRLQKSLRDEVNALTGRNIILEKEWNAVDVKVADLEVSAVSKERELTDLHAHLTFVKSHNDSLADQVHELEIASFVFQEKLSSYENLTERLEEIQDAQLKAHMVLKEVGAAEAIRLRVEASSFVTMKKSLQDEVNVVNERSTILEKEWDALDVKVADLEASVVIKEHEMTDLNAQITFVKSHNDIFVDQCLHSPEYFSALGAAIGKAIENGMQDALSAGITHGAKGRVLTDVAVYNPSAEADYISALQHLQNLNFPLLAELRSNKDASVDTVMNILRLKKTLAERLCLTESQPHVDQLMVPVVIGASAVSLALDVSSSRVRKIKENIANHRPALRDVFVPLVEPLSATALTGTKGTSNVISATANTTMALSTTLASASIVAPISVDDYEVVGTDDQTGADGNANPFPNVDDPELNILL